MRFTDNLEIKARGIFVNFDLLVPLLLTYYHLICNFINGQLQETPNYRVYANWNTRTIEHS